MAAKSVFISWPKYLFKRKSFGGMKKKRSSSLGTEARGEQRH
jgi:hypothetical protein